MGSATGVLKSFLSKPVAANFLLGMSEAYPRMMIGTVLTYWLTEPEYGVSSESIGLFAAVTTPYVLKLGWSPLADRLHLGRLTRTLGQRIGWLVVVMALMAIAVMGLVATGPGISLQLTFLFALLFGLGGAMHDTIVDAYRIEIMKEEHYGPGATLLTWGYRTLTLFMAWAAPYYSDSLGWPLLFALSLVSLVPLVVVMIWVGEPDARASEAVDEDGERVSLYLQKDRGFRPGLAAVGGFLYASAVLPFREFTTRRAWLAVLLFVMFFKLSDAVVSALITDFLRNGAGFDKDVLASVKGVVGGVMLWVGISAAALIYAALGMYRTLMLTVILMGVTNLGFAWLANLPMDFAGFVAQAPAEGGDTAKGWFDWLAVFDGRAQALALVISAENFVSGMSAMVLVAFLSHMTSRAFAATQYALLSSMASLGYTLVGSFSGFLKTALGWEMFFILSAVMAVPAIFLLLAIWNHPGAQITSAGAAPDKVA